MDSCKQGKKEGKKSCYGSVMALKTTRKPKVLLFICLFIKGPPHPKKKTLGVIKEREKQGGKTQFLKLNPTPLARCICGPKGSLSEQQRPTQTM